MRVPMNERGESSTRSSRHGMQYWTGPSERVARRSTASGRYKTGHDTHQPYLFRWTHSDARLRIRRPVHAAARAPPRRHAGRPHHGHGLRGRAPEDRGLAAGRRGLQAGPADAGQLSRRLLGELVGPGDIIVDLSWNVETFDMLAWCGEHDVRYINTSLEEWDPYGDIENKSPYERSLYSRQMRVRQLKDRLNSRAARARRRSSTTARIPASSATSRSGRCSRSPPTMLEGGPAGGDRRQHGGVREARSPPPKARREGSFARLSQATGTKVIHISERDTQVSSQPKAVDEFVNTWSIEGFYEEGTAPAELGWGTHERRLPKHAHTPIGGPGNQIFLAQPGIRTFVHSWVPAGGPIIGMVVRHAESFTISDYLTVWEDTIEGRRAGLPSDRALRLHAVRQRDPQPLRADDAQLPAAAEAANHVGRDHRRHRRARRAAHGPRPHHAGGPARSWTSTRRASSCPARTRRRSRWRRRCWAGWST